jgi:hypothetical protein
VGKMNTEDVIEIFKMSIINGDVNNAYKIVERNMKRYEKKGNTVEKEFMEYLIKGMNGELSYDNIYSVLVDDKYNIFPYIKDYKGYIFALIDAMRYSINRYNIKYPDFDAKRCDDL